MSVKRTDISELYVVQMEKKAAAKKAAAGEDQEDIETETVPRIYSEESEENKLFIEIYNFEVIEQIVFMVISIVYASTIIEPDVKLLEKYNTVKFENDIIKVEELLKEARLKAEAAQNISDVSSPSEQRNWKQEVCLLSRFKFYKDGNATNKNDENDENAAYLRDIINEEMDEHDSSVVQFLNTCFESLVNHSTLFMTETNASTKIKTAKVEADEERRKKVLAEAAGPAPAAPAGADLAAAAEAGTAAAV